MPDALRPTVLTRRGTDVLVRVERLMEDATRALAHEQRSGQGGGCAGWSAAAKARSRRPSNRPPVRFAAIDAPVVFAASLAFDITRSGRLCACSLDRCLLSPLRRRSVLA